MRRFALGLLLLAPVSASAQLSRYDLYGTPVEVTIADLVTSATAYSGRAVRTKGSVDLGRAESGERTYRLRDSFAYSVAIIPVQEIAGEFDFGSSTLLGREIEVTGLFSESSSLTSANPMSGSGLIQFWSYLVIPTAHERELARARSIPLTQLASQPGRHDGRLVRVTGVFRGLNLFGDLPAKSRRKRDDWVLSEGEHAIWVTGKKPRGEGWELDPALKRDSGKWIEVLGRVETHDGIIYVRAEKLTLSGAPPEALASATPTPRPVERPKVPPVVVFALPLDGEAEVPGDSRFTLQFSKDMDEASFAGHVELRYLGAPRPGQRPLPAVTFAYDAGRRALTVDPGDRLGLGTDLELRLLPGIKDIDGLELIPRKGPAADGVVDALRYHVGA